MFTEENAKVALLNFAKKDKVKAKLLEKMLRLETAHFKSKQYQLTGSAGMEDGAWGAKVKPYFPNGYKTITMNDNHPELRGKKAVQFIVWSDTGAFLQFLSDYIDRHDGNYARWNSLDTARQEAYRKEVNSIKNRIII